MAIFNSYVKLPEGSLHSLDGFNMKFEDHETVHSGAAATFVGFETAILHGFSFPSRDTVKIASAKITLWAARQRHSILMAISMQYG